MVQAKANATDNGKQKVTAAVTALCLLVLPIAALLAGCARVPRRGIIPTSARCPGVRCKPDVSLPGRSDYD
jgi:hypothetical protein